jgi:zinc transporter ZupT
LLGAAFLDLLPEALSLNATLTGRTIDVLGIALLAFLLFFGLQSLLDLATSRWQSTQSALGRIGGALLIVHSLRDGMAIGLAYAASHPAGIAVAVGIAAHDLGDGMNTVVLTTGGRKPKLGDYLFLAADALAPLLGGLLTIWWTFSPRSSVILLAIAAGFFIQMASSDFLPEVRQWTGSRRLLLPAAVLSGAAVIYLANLITARAH